jgi:hypothetical protein
MAVANGPFGAEAVRIEAVYDVKLVAEPLRQLAKNADARLAPGGGNQDLIHVGTVDAVKAGRLVIDVDNPHRHEEEAAPQIEATTEQAVEVRLLDFDLTPIVGRRDGVLDLHFGIEAYLLGKVVPEVEDQPAQVDGRGSVAGRVQRKLAIATECATRHRRTSERDLDVGLARKRGQRGRRRHAGIGGRGRWRRRGFGFAAALGRLAVEARQRSGRADTFGGC